MNKQNTNGESKMILKTVTAKPLYVCIQTLKHGEANSKALENNITIKKIHKSKKLKKARFTITVKHEKKKAQKQRKCKSST